MARVKDKSGKAKRDPDAIKDESGGRAMSSVLSQQYEMVPIEQLIPHPANPRRGNVDAIVESIQHNQFFGSVLAQKSTRHVVVGNHRLAAAQAAGLAEVPCIWLDISDEQAKRILIADNRLSDIAVNDDQALASLLKQLLDSEDGLLGTGYLDTDLDDLLKLLGEEPPMLEDVEPRMDEAEALREKWGVEVGQLWVISRPRKCPKCGSEAIDEV